MSSAAPGTSRGGSRSSIRTSQRPSFARASRKLASAAIKEPKWSGPVGDGANLPRYGAKAADKSHAFCRRKSGSCPKKGFGRFFQSTITVVPVAVLLFAPLAALLCLDAERGDRPRLEA